MIATQYSTASEATGCRHSTTAFESSCDYRVPASGRFARGTVLSGDHVGVLPYSTNFSHSLYRVVVLTSWDCGMSELKTDRLICRDEFRDSN